MLIKIRQVAPPLLALAGYALYWVTLVRHDFRHLARYCRVCSVWRCRLVCRLCPDGQQWSQSRLMCTCARRNRSSGAKRWSATTDDRRWHGVGTMSPRGSGSRSGGGGEDDGGGRPAMACPAGTTGNGTFHCLTGGQCVNVTDVCNGIDDCVDASDESFTHAHCYGT